MASSARARGLRDPATIALVGLSAVAFALRVSGIDQSLYGDELLTFDDVGSGLGGIPDRMDINEVNPPLFFYAAWASAQLGDETTLIRLPSILLGTATVPVVYLLARQILGRGPSLLAAALVTLSPFAVFYSVEARPYASMVFFVALAALALLRALGDGGRGWWAVYVLAAAGALYTQYSSVFALMGAVAWAALAHRERLKALLLANAAVALVFLPWLPEFLDQRGKGIHTAVIGAGVDLDFANAWEFVLRLFVGHPFRHLPIVPGDAALAVLAAATAILIAAVALWLGRAGLPRPRLTGPAGLLLVMAVAVPVGLLLYGAVGDDLYVPRNLSAATPALAVLAAGAMTAPAVRVSAVVVGLVLVAMVLALVHGLDPDQLRPQSREAAEYIEREAPPGAPVVRGLGEVNALRVYLRGHPILDEFGNDAPAWAAAASGGSAFLLHGEVGRLILLPRFAGPDGLFELVEKREFPGLRRLGVGRYMGKVSGRLRRVGGSEVLVLSPGRDIAVRPGAVRGVRDRVEVVDGQLDVTGWAIAADAGRPADSLFLLDGDRLVAVAAPTVLRPDVAARFGSDVEGSGFSLRASLRDPGRLASSPRLRTFAAVGSVASELRPAP